VEFNAIDEAREGEKLCLTIGLVCTLFCTIKGCDVHDEGAQETFVRS
jgi:hypothetical protein